MSGVPQGSQLTLILFNFVVNYIGKVIDCNLFMFADNLKNFVEEHSLQRYLNNIGDWCMSNGLHLNTAKCHVIPFKRETRILTFGYCLNHITLPNFQCVAVGIDQLSVIII